MKYIKKFISSVMKLLLIDKVTDFHNLFSVLQHKISKIRRELKAWSLFFYIHVVLFSPFRPMPLFVEQMERVTKMSVSWG